MFKLALIANCSDPGAPAVGVCPAGSQGDPSQHTCEQRLNASSCLEPVAGPSPPRPRCTLRVHSDAAS